MRRGMWISSFTLAFLVVFNGAAQSTMDRDSDLGQTKVRLIQQYGKPIREITEVQKTLKSFESVLIYDDTKDPDRLDLYFIQKQLVGAVAMVDYYAKGDQAYLEDLKAGDATLVKEGFSLPLDLNPPKATDDWYTNADRSEFVYVATYDLEDGGTMVVTLNASTIDQINLADLVLEKIDNDLVEVVAPEPSPTPEPVKP